MIEIYARLKRLKYSPALNPLQVPCVVHSCWMSVSSGIMSSIPDGLERPEEPEQFSGSSMNELRPQSVHDKSIMAALAFRAVAVSVAEFWGP